VSRIITEGLGGKALVTGGYGASGGGATYTRALSIAQGTLPDIGSLKARLVALAAVQPSGAAVARLTAKAFAAQQASGAALGKAIGKTLGVASAATATLSALASGAATALGVVFRSGPRLATLVSTRNRLFRSAGR